MERGHFSWIELIPQIGEHHELIPFVHSMIIAVGLLAAAMLVRVTLMGRKKNINGLVPSERLTLPNMFELFAEFILDLLRPLLHHDTKLYFPLLATVFLYILVMNLSGLIPGVQPPTAHLETNAAMAVTVYAGFNILGFKEHGLGYLKHFAGPVIFLAPFMFVLEIVSHIFRPISLTLRLYGNMMGDHSVLGVFMYSLPEQLSQVLAYGIPVVFLGLGVFVSVVQAMVFTLLSAAYIGGAVAHDH